MDQVVTLSVNAFLVQSDFDEKNPSKYSHTNTLKTQKIRAGTLNNKKNDKKTRHRQPFVRRPLK